MEAAVRPLPKEEITPPVMKRNLATNPHNLNRPCIHSAYLKEYAGGCQNNLTAVPMFPAFAQDLATG